MLCFVQHNECQSTIENQSGIVNIFAVVNGYHTINQINLIDIIFLFAISTYKVYSDSKPQEAYHIQFTEQAVPYSNSE